MSTLDQFALSNKVTLCIYDVTDIACVHTQLCTWVITMGHSVSVSTYNSVADSMN